MKRRVLVRRLVSVLLLTLVVTGVAWVALSAEVGAGFQRRATDALFPGALTSKQVAVVGIDREAIRFFNDPLPWPRARMAELTDKLADAGAAVIVFDLVFSQQSDSPPDDEAFAQSIERAGNVVLGEGITKFKSQKGGLPPLAVEGTGVYEEFAKVAAGARARTGQPGSRGRCRAQRAARVRHADSGCSSLRCRWPRSCACGARIRSSCGPVACRSATASCRPATRPR